MEVQPQARRREPETRLRLVTASRHLTQSFHTARCFHRHLKFCTQVTHHIIAFSHIKMSGDVELDSFKPTGLLGLKRDAPIPLVPDELDMFQDEDDLGFKPTGLLGRTNTLKSGLQDDMHMDSETVEEEAEYTFKSTGLLKPTKERGMDLGASIL